MARFQRICHHTGDARHTRSTQQLVRVTIHKSITKYPLYRKETDALSLMRTRDIVPKLADVPDGWLP